MIEVYATAHSMGVSDESMELWLDQADIVTGQSPRAMIVEGRAHEVIDMLEAKGLAFA